MLKKLFKAQFFFKYQNLFRSKFVSLLNKLDKLDKKYRRFLLIVLDTLILILSALFINFIFSGSTLENFKILGFNSIFSLVIISLLVFYFSGQYTSITKYIRPIFIYKIAFRNLIVIGTFLIMRLTFGLNISLLRIYLLFWFVNTSLIIISRFTIKETLIFKDYLKTKKSLKVVIFGAGAAGAQLASSLILSGEYKIEAFLDDSPKLWGRRLSDIRIYPPDELYNLRENIDQILIAIPSLSKLEKFEIIKKFENCDIQIIQIPSIKSITERQQNILNSNELSIDDLLGRKSVDPDWNLIKPEINNSVICITGAGGSIGSEICREIIKLNPKLLIMVDNHEYSLYKIEKEFSNKNNLRFILGNICDEELIKNVFKDLKVQIVFHCAAYKHVPLLESNKIICLKNNINSTKVICKQAFENNIQKLILISSDKAVRPTNIMGASKRLAELIVQAYSTKSKELSNSDHTIFSMVRFGNVLGSSGSVVPLFQKQISQGGPITLTDKKVIRFFMTINEASHLVLHASAMAKGGEVFLLDMGEPVNIYSLAKQMITINGLKIKDKNNPNGDIEIQTIGLRKGEKLYEELLIDAESETTEHQLIYRANESSIKPEILFKKLNELDISLNEFNIKKSIDLLNELVKDWNIKN